jgi:dephospho-CoA kinase
MSHSGHTDKQSTPFVVALTGGIASGKTTVSDLFAELGVSVVAAFGHELLDAYGRLKRRKLRKLIFSNQEKREQLEAMMHPEIAAEARKRINEVKSGYCILVIPLLAEAGGYAGVDRVLVVDTEVDSQFERLTARDDVSREQAELAINAQASREQRLSIADDVIVNSGNREQLRQKVEALHQEYLSYCN